MRINDLILGILMALLGAITVWASRDFPSLPRQDYGAGTFPALIGTLLVVLGGVLSLRGWQGRGAMFAWRGDVALKHAMICVVAVVGAVVGYVLLTPVLGFPIVSLVMLTVLIGWLTGGRWWLALTIALVATLLIWMTFAELLLVPLSLGILEEVIY